MDRIERTNQRIDLLEEKFKSLEENKNIPTTVTNATTIEHTGLKVLGVGLCSLGYCLLIATEIFFKIPYGWWIGTAITGFFTTITILTGDM